MSTGYEVSGPAAVIFVVKDAEASAEFYEQKLGFRRDPQKFSNGAIAFLTYPIPLGVIEAPSGEAENVTIRPGAGVNIWFKTADSQRMLDALVDNGVTILLPLRDGRFGGQFTLADPDGYAITVYDRDAPAGGWEEGS